MSGDLFPKQGAALVIGGTGGLGQAIVPTLAENNTDVAFTYFGNRAAADELAAAGPGRIEAFRLDLGDRESIVAAVDAVVEAYGGIHSLVYAAGAPIYLKYIGQIEPNRMAHHLDSDVMGFFNIVQATLPHIRAARGSYVACCSCGVEKWPIKDALSVVPKTAVMAITKGIAREEGRFGVRANVVGTGVINAGITLAGITSGDVPESFVSGAVQMTPLGRLGEAQDIAEAVLYLASRRASFVTGQVLNVDGGWTI